MLSAIVRGECDANVLAEPARKRLRAKIPELRGTLTGSVTNHHRFLLRQWLELLLSSKISEFDLQSEEAMRPYAAAAETLISIPGVDRVAACSLVAEIGVDMPTRCPVSFC